MTLTKKYEHETEFTNVSCLWNYAYQLHCMKILIKKKLKKSKQKPDFRSVDVRMPKYIL